jgi:hypothetical protein
MKNFLPLNKKKESCCNCFKIFLKDNINIELQKKNFCSKECKKIFEDKIMVIIDYKK